MNQYQLNQAMPSSSSVYELVGTLARISSEMISLRERLRTINATLSGAVLPDTISGPKPVPDGLVGAMQESVMSISSVTSSMSDDLDRLSRSLGIDQPASTR